MNTICTKDNCVNKVRCKGLCSKHYNASRYANPVTRNAILENCRKYRTNNKDTIKNKRRKGTYADNDRYSRSKSTAKRRGITWALSFDDFAKLSTYPCYYCGTTGNSTGSRLDRIDNALGYTIDNVLPCCGDCNSLKREKYTVEETKIMINALIVYRNAKLESVK